MSNVSRDPPSAAELADYLREAEESAGADAGGGGGGGVSAAELAAVAKRLEELKRAREKRKRDKA